MWSNSTTGPTALARLGGLLLAMCLSWPALTLAVEPVLPESLGQWYKPQNQRQVWLHTMFAMRRELQAVREYAAAGDAERLTKWLQALGEHYRRLPEMVPEWRDHTDLELMEELQARGAAGDFAGTLQAADRLERDCRACHRQYQALTALRYRWPRFDALQIDDGHGGALPYREYMELLSGTLNRIKIASEDDRWEQAQASLRELRSQLQTLGEGCQSCHADGAPRARILGDDTAATLDRLALALEGQDPKGAGRFLGEAAVQTCARCHGVHRLLSEVQRHLFE